MGRRSRYEPGTFCWIDLATTDPEAAKSFYGDLFGWTSERLLEDGGFTYDLMKLNGETVCGIYLKGDEVRSRDLPPYGMSYVNVENVAATAERSRELGGTVIEEPYGDDAGLMTTLSDPEGAMIVAYQPLSFSGSSRVNDPGCLTWNELQTRDPESVSDFYSSLFGWTLEPMEEDGKTVYVTIENRGSANGGWMPMNENHGDIPPYWLVYFTTEDIDASVAKINDLGGGVMAGPMEIMEGSRIAVVHDPQGAAFALFEGETDD